VARQEVVEVRDGVRWATVVIPRVTLPDRPVSRLGTAIEVSDLDEVLAGLVRADADLARRLLRAGLGRWRQWPALLRRPPDWLDIPTAERDVVPQLLRHGALSVRERPSAAGVASGWSLDAFRTADAVRDQLGLPDVDAIRDALREELVSPALLALAEHDPPAGFDWRAYAFVLRAAEAWRDYDSHGVRPRDRELAAGIWHSKAFTPARRRLLVTVLDRSEGALFESRLRQLRVRGPLVNPETSLWAHTVESVALTASDELIGILCVENSRTFDALDGFSERGWLVLEVPGNAPRAEVELLARAHALAPRAPVLAAFDPDPGGVRIAQSLSARSGVTLDPAPMSVAALGAARPLSLEEWDLTELRRLSGRAGPHEALVAEMRRRAVKGSRSHSIRG